MTSLCKMATRLLIWAVFITHAQLYHALIRPSPHSTSTGHDVITAAALSNGAANRNNNNNNNIRAIINDVTGANYSFHYRVHHQKHRQHEQNNDDVTRWSPSGGRLRLRALVRRIRRHTAADIEMTTVGAGLSQAEWSHDVASQTLDELDTALVSAVERCFLSTSNESTTSSLRYLLPVAVRARFSPDVASVLHAANVISLLHHNSMQYNVKGDDLMSFYNWFIRALLDSSSDYVHSTTLAILHHNDVIVAPQVWRSIVSGVPRVHLRDVRGTVMAADWFDAILKQPRGGRCDNSTTGYGGVVSGSRDVIWTSPLVNCSLAMSHGSTVVGSWLVSLTAPVYDCDDVTQHVIVRGAVTMEIDLNKVSINQCSNGSDAFSDTHRCTSTTFCQSKGRRGLRRGHYQCHCNAGFYFPSSTARSSAVKYFEGQAIESRYRLDTENQYDVTEFSCLPCTRGCAYCDDASSCDDDVTSFSVVLLGVHIVLMAASVATGVAVIRLRRTKVMKSSFWLLLEVVVMGVVLIQTSVVLEYFYPSGALCLSVPWLREVGFAVVYGSLQLKIFRVLAEFQSRKAQRILLRDSDLLKYLFLLVVIVIVYLVTWTVVTLDHVSSGDVTLLTETRHVTGSRLLKAYCRQGWWHYVIETGECLFLCIGIYLCYCARSAPSVYLETKFISFAIFNELLISTAYYIARHCVWLLIDPSHVFIMSFLRCHLTATVTLLLIIVTKIWFTHRPPSERACRRRAYSTSDSAPTAVTSGECIGEQIKLSADSGVDVGEINLADMNPEDIRTELRRLYTQLQVYKTKSMRRDNPHISKRRGGRKPTHRRFSLQAFHYKHRLQQPTTSSAACGGQEQSVGEGHDLEPASRTPEESTNSAEGGQVGLAGNDEQGSASPRVTSSGGHRK